jgi:hypothetical protein
MEIEFELENTNIIVDFIPDFRVQTNASDQTKVSWRLPSRATPLNVGVLCNELSDEGSIYPTITRCKDV